MVINTAELSPEEAAQEIILHLEQQGFIGVDGTRELEAASREWTQEFIMALIAAKILIGFCVGTLIGLTGLGGGVLLLPILIFGLRVPAIVAVGSDALFNFFTKIPASLVHLRKGTVRRKVVVALAVGSVPGSARGRCLPHSPSPSVRRWRQQLHQDWRSASC